MMKLSWSVYGAGYMFEPSMSDIRIGSAELHLMDVGVQNSSLLSYPHFLLILVFLVIFIL